MDERLGAVWDNVCADPSEGVRRLFLLEHELWLRAARDTRLASALKQRIAGIQRTSLARSRQMAERRTARAKLLPRRGLGVVEGAWFSGCTCSCRPIPDSVDRASAIDALGASRRCPAPTLETSNRPQADLAPAEFR